MPITKSRTERVPVRAAVALAGAGSLGTFLAGAVQELVIRIRHHNVAISEDADNDDARLLNPEWGHITIDAIGGSSAGAISGSQLIKSLFQPRYVGEGKAIDAIGTITGDWIHGGEFAALAPEGNHPSESGPIEAPGWALMSGANLYDLVRTLLEPSGTTPDWPGNPIDPTGIVALGVTLTDLLGFHEPADFYPDQVLGHQQFGRPELSASRILGHLGMEIRDLGGRGHGETRKVFVARDNDAYERVREFLRITNRRGRARGVVWSPHAAVRLASLCAASAALPLAIGPVALTDRAAELEVECRRLYLDGGMLNNKPVSPALKLSRWHDSVRMLAGWNPDDGPMDVDYVRSQLNYKRVCFFLDAFPDRAKGDWRSPHPDEAFRGDFALRLTDDANRARNQRIDEALDRPTSALNVLFESVMSSLRAQDIRNIAKTNFLLHERASFISERCATPPRARPEFEIDSIAKAQALAAVMRLRCSDKLSDDELRAVGERIWEADRLSGLGGRRRVTMIPIFAPTNLKAVFAGEALYAVGGLLSRDARRHDALVGRQVAQSVLDSLRTPQAAADPLPLPDAPDSALPKDTTVLIDRIRVAFKAFIDANIPNSGPLRFFAKLPINVAPLVQMAKVRLDQAVLGLPPEDEE